MPVYTHAGLKLHYADAGQGPVILLLHAFPLTGEMFHRQCEALSHKFRFIVPDLRGFGRSEVPTGPSEMSTFADDAIALLDHLGIESAVVGGVSMGGYTAMSLTQMEPSRVRALVLADTQMGADDEAGKARREQVAQDVETRGMVSVVESQLPKLLAQPANPDTERWVRKLMLENPPSGTAAASRGMALRPDSKGILARFANPALVLVGERDAITPREKAQAMVDVLSNAGLEVIPRAGHLSNLENPDAFNQALDAFVSAIS